MNGTERDDLRKDEAECALFLFPEKNDFDDDGDDPVVVRGPPMLVSEKHWMLQMQLISEITVRGFILLLSVDLEIYQ